MSPAQGRGGVSRRLRGFVVAVYVLAAALLPLGHHDVVCHLKSSSHCVTCVAGSSAEDTGESGAGAAILQDVAGYVGFPSPPLVLTISPGPGCGRAPPAC